MRWKWVAGAGLLAAVAPAFAADWGFDDWDVDGDRLIKESEFGARIESQGIFEARDLNGNDVLEPWEWERAGFLPEFGEWDENGDGVLSESEFRDGIFAYWDEDLDRQLTAREWQAGRAQNPLR